MTVRELIKELELCSPDAEVAICHCDVQVSGITYVSSDLEDGEPSDPVLISAEGCEEWLSRSAGK